MRFFPLVLVLFAAGGAACELVEVWLALLAVPALLWAPGAAWSKHAATQVALSAVASGLGLWASHTVGPWALWAPACGLALVGALRGGRASRASPGWGAGAVTVAICLALYWGDISRPLERYWWDARGEDLPEQGAEPVISGFEVRPVGRARVLTGAGEITMDGVLVMCGEVGDQLVANTMVASIEADPMVDPDEGPVPRYLERGCVSVSLSGQAAVSSASKDAVFYAIPDAQALWELHAEGELRFGHYYQLLNMVEQLRWAREVGHTRWVTDVQPPLWSWVLGVVLRGTAGGLPSANVLLVYIVGAITMVGLAVVRRFGGGGLSTPLIVLAAVMHGRLMLEPGSAGMPDSLYALALVGVAATGAARWGVIAQLSRYPGTLVAGLLLALEGRWLALLRLMGGVFALMLGFGAIGWMTGELPVWLDTVGYETGPEHWHGEHDPMVLLARAPGFYLTWLGYAGLAPILALTGWTRGVRVLLGSAVLYSLLLCTIDHSPSHYFLPLLHLSVLAVCVARPGRWAWRRWACAAGLLWALYGVAVTG